MNRFKILVAVCLMGAIATAGIREQKDLRLVELKNGQIGVFTRPWPHIAYTTVRSLDELSIQTMEKAKVIDGLYEGGWGGANGVTVLPDGTLLVAAHVSYHDHAKKRRVYSAAAFEFDPQTRKASPCRIVATSRMFPFKGEPLDPALADVVYTTGFIFNGDGTADIYGSINDAGEGWVRVKADLLLPNQPTAGISGEATLSPCRGAGRLAVDLPLRR